MNSHRDSQDKLLEVYPGLGVSDRTFARAREGWVHHGNFRTSTTTNKYMLQLTIAI